MFKRLLADFTAGTPHTNSTDETVLKSYTIPADTLQVGHTLRFRAACRIPDNNSTDTLVLKARLGDTTLTGTVIATTPTVDVADGDSAVLEGDLYVTAIGSAGTVDAACKTVGPDGGGTVTGTGQSTAVTGLDTTGALLLEITGDWSVAHADNQVACHSLTVDLVA